MLSVEFELSALLELVVLVELVAPAESCRLRVGDDEQLETRNKQLKIKKVLSCCDLIN